MAKPTRRERRRLAEQGKLTPRRSTVNVPAPRNTLPTTERTTRGERLRVEGARRDTLSPAAPAAERPMLSDRQEYAYVRSDLARIMVLAGTLIAAMVALKFVLPQ
ncbi:MAG: hypothetical protein LC737_06375 [Chloroflexi bacterium]|nr:hypothetical protein [Chloroflexota bacterium]